MTEVNGSYLPTQICDEGIAQKLGIPIPYVRRMREERPDLWDANVNGWLHGQDEMLPTGDGEVWTRQRSPADPRSFLLRTFTSDTEEPGIARAFLSDRYAVIDHLDALTAALDGVREAGLEVKIDGCDLTERRMSVRIIAPEVQALAPELLKGYRSPFSGASGDENPTVFAGFQISNSETGGGAFQIVPRLIVQICNNGMTITKDAVRAVHLGGQLDGGVIKWSQETQSKNVELVRMRTRDAVRTYLDVDYMKTVIDDLSAKSGKPIEKPVDDVKVIAKKLAYSEESTNGILDFFIRGGQTTAGGLMQAVTAYAQTVDDGDLAAELEISATKVLDLV